MALYPMNETATRNLTRRVVAYQQTGDPALHAELKKEIMELLYTIPSTLRILDPEDCCEFLFYCLSAIDNLIAGYEEGKLSFVGFLTEVVRRRVRFFLCEQRQRERQLRLIHRSECLFPESGELGFESAEPPIVYTFKGLPTGSIASLPALFAALLRKRTSSTYPIRKELEELKAVLTRGVNRKRMLITLTITPSLYAHHLLEELSSLLLFDLTDLCRYLNTASLALHSKEQIRQDFERTCTRHFRRLLEIEQALEDESDEEKKRKLVALRDWTQEKYRKKIAKLRSMEKSLSHRQVGELLGIPKGTVSSSVFHIKKLLHAHMDEKGVNDYP
ncbi:MAG: hypothetical protein GX911_03395 [Spirochaetales bacterium]|nr:hypothetical protein [Spirochaetales bacterium]